MGSRLQRLRPRRGRPGGALKATHRPGKDMLNNHARNPSTLHPSSERNKRTEATNGAASRFVPVPPQVLHALFASDATLAEHRIVEFVLLATIGVYSKQRFAPVRARDVAEVLRIPCEGSRGARWTINELVRRRILLRGEGRAIAVNDKVDEWAARGTCHGNTVAPATTSTRRSRGKTVAPATGSRGTCHDAAVAPATGKPWHPPREAVAPATMYASQVEAGACSPTPRRVLESDESNREMRDASAPSASPEVEPRDTSPRPTDETARSEPAGTKQGALIPDVSPTPRKRQPKPSPVENPDVIDVWTHWQRVTGRVRATLSDKRAKVILSRIKRFGVEGIKRVIDRVAQSDHHRGKYDLWETAPLRDEARCEMWADEPTEMATPTNGATRIPPPPEWTGFDIRPGWPAETVALFTEKRAAYERELAAWEAQHGPADAWQGDYNRTGNS